jgi:hypothetical protein
MVCAFKRVGTVSRKRGSPEGEPKSGLLNTSTKIAPQKPSVNEQDDVLSPPRRCIGRSVSTRTVAKDTSAEGRLYPLI